MSMWTAITLIVIACVFGGALRKRWESGNAAASNEKLQELEAKIDRLDAELRERIETLERIVTDRKEDLKRQFDRLDKAS